MEYRDIVESFSHENTKRRKTELTTKGGKVDKKLMRDMENLAIEDVTAEDWKMDDGSLEEALGTMNLDKAVKDIVLKKISKGQGSSTQGSASESSSSEDESDKKKKKSDKKQLLKKEKNEKKTKANKKTKSSSARSTRGLDDLEKTSQLADSDGKPEFKNKMATFENAMTKDLDYFKDLSSSDSSEQLFIDGARQALEKALKSLAQAKKSLKMEEVKTALTASYDALKKSKAAKTFCQSSKRKS